MNDPRQRAEKPPIARAVSVVLDAKARRPIPVARVAPDSPTAEAQPADEVLPFWETPIGIGLAKLYHWNKYWYKYIVLRWLVIGAVAFAAWRQGCVQGIQEGRKLEREKLAPVIEVAHEAVLGKYHKEVFHGD
jgi:hypothetical protein